MSDLLLIVAVLVVLVVGGGEACMRNQCSNYESITGTETRWAPLDTCYIHTAHGWQRWDEFKARAVASEGLKETRR